MSAPPSTYQANLSRREEMAVSGAALSNAPWKLAGATGVIVAAADIVAHLIFFHLEFLNPVALGVAAFFAVAGAGALVRSRNSRALRWARSRPWRFAVHAGSRRRHHRVRPGRASPAAVSPAASFTRSGTARWPSVPPGWSARSSGRAATSEPDPGQALIEPAARPSRRSAAAAAACRLRGRGSRARLPGQPRARGARTRRAAAEARRGRPARHQAARCSPNRAAAR